MVMIALAIWIVFLLAAILYAQHARHPQAKALAAYLVFVTVFTVTAFVIFAAVIFALQALGATAILGRPVVEAVVLVLVFVPAFFIARWQLRKPPSHWGQP